MRYCFLFTLLPVAMTGTAARAVEPSDLKPGLIAAYADTRTGDNSLTVTRLEPTVALNLGKGETPDSSMKSLATARWSGYVNITRPGKYRFDADIDCGRVEVKLGGKVVFTGAGGGGVADSHGAQVQLAGGVQPIEVTFAVSGHAPQLALYWEGPGFIREPLPHQFLGHLAKDRPGALALDLEREHGRFLFEELACVKCHKPAAGEKLLKGLAERTGPNLTEIAKRAYPGWINSWLADPAKHRPNTTMPKLFADDERGNAERFAITKYLISLSGTSLRSYRPPLVARNEYRQSFERGRVLYTVAGCAACHDEAKAVVKADEEEREPLKPEDYIYSLGTTGPTAKYDLGVLGSKTRPEALAAYLQNPLKTNPAGRMPNMNLN
ncbi:MAG TPA: PA14 domain-containing protein, partial [Gemmata sp.]|nr:PA14 domain-containing protein [Gemmata sp.]